MAKENLMVGTHKTSNDEYRKNHEDTFGPSLLNVSAIVNGKRKPVTGTYKYNPNTKKCEMV